MDIIHTSLIKSYSTVFAKTLSTLANLSITQGIFPSRFKLAQVTPILKKVEPDKDLPSNYRQISNLNNVSKILERLILNRLKNNISSSLNLNVNPLQSVYKNITQLKLRSSSLSTTYIIQLTLAHQHSWFSKI